MNPICEAKFYPITVMDLDLKTRSVKHGPISTLLTVLAKWQNIYHYGVDIDIKGFFF